ncbi:MAG: TIGR02301 family protein [Bradyrhizobium sp.]|nr:MAG: TIGR02301 family protein [Bradyrhizobium sp.]
MRRFLSALAGATALFWSAPPLFAAPPLFSAPPADAQTAAPPSPTPQAAAPAKPVAAKPAPAPTPTPTTPEVPPPYEPQLLRLSEIIGALSYLRDLCGDGDGDAFRAKFSTLVDTEGATETRKDALAGAFNRGFRDYQLTYRACTPTAREIITRFLDEAEHISRDVANRYAG